MSIRLKLTIIILALVSIPLLCVSVISFSNYENSLESARLSQLDNLADFKAERIESYFAEVRTKIEMSQSFYIIRKHLPLLIRSGNGRSDPAVAAAKKVLDGQLRVIQKAAGLSDIMLTDNNGRIVYASNPGHNATTRSLPEIQLASFKEGLNRIFFSEIFLNEPAGNSPAMLVTAPAFDLNDTVVGIIVFEMDMAPLYTIIQDTAGLGKTGEILIGKTTSADEILYLNPLRHDPGAALKRIVHAGDSIALPVQNAVLGKTGTGRSIDYRGKKVVAAWRYIPSLKWGLVAKIDSAEAFAVVADLRRLLIMVLAVVFTMVSIIALSIARSISLPIQTLSRGAEIIGGGDLDHRVGMNLNDEIGRLSRSFDKMTHDLKETTASRDELNKEIAERTRIEDALRESEAGLKRAQEISHLGNWELNIPDNRLTWSDEVYRIFGLAPQEFSATYEAFLEAVHPDDRAAVNDAYSGSLRDGKDTYEIEHRVVRKKSGEIRIVHEKCEHFRDVEGKIVRSVGMVHDITERKIAEEKVLLAKEEWERTFDSVPDLIAIMDRNHTIMRVNMAMAKKLGRLPDECRGLSCYKAVHGTTEPPPFCPHSSLLDDGKEHAVELHENALGGDFLVTTTPLLDPDGRISGSVHVARDITERKRSEEALRLSAEELARSNRDLEQFAYVASHDLQEPLRAVSGFVELLKQELKGSLNAKTTEYIDFSIDGAKRMQALINGLLEYSRVGTRGKKPLLTDANAALDEAISRLRTSIRESGAKITHGDLPMVYFDEVQLSQLFQNLIGNAVKFRGEMAPVIHISADRVGDSWQFAVSDNGIGIEPEYVAKIFLIFQRLHGRGKYPGTGIGLAICKKIVERHNGKIRVESTPGSGSTFYFTIPDKGENA